MSKRAPTPKGGYFIDGKLRKTLSKDDFITDGHRSSKVSYIIVDGTRVPTTKCKLVITEQQGARYRAAGH